MRGLAAIGIACVVLLCACGGGGSTLVPKVYTAAQTAVIQSGENTCIITYTVHDDGTAERTSQECSGVSGASNTDVIISASIVSKFLSDIQNAQPLSELPRALTVDTFVIVSWNGQQSPNISGANETAAEQTLLGDVDAITQAFPTQ